MSGESGILRADLPIRSRVQTMAASSTAATKAAKATEPRASKIAVRQSPIHGRGVYAARKLRAGEKIIEYTGERIGWDVADQEPSADPGDPNHTFLFALADGKTVIDAARGGNSSRWINHSCAPNCETEESESARVFIHALRDIAAGEELNYDYGLVIDQKLTKSLKREYRCLCGAPDCRGTMLAIKDKKKKDKKKKKKRQAAQADKKNGKG